MDYLHNPSYIPDIDHVKNIIQSHIDWDNLIYIYGDYDVDGVCGSAILYKTLKKMGAEYVYTVISDRFRDGYGLSKEAIDIMHNCGAHLIVTVDCGISDGELIEYAKSKNIDVIVLDHHETDDPPGCPFIDLKVNSQNYPYTKLSGAGITWKVCQHLSNENLFNLLDILTMSTVADVVPLRNENRVIVNRGLKKLSQTHNKGLDSLLRVSYLKSKDITTGHVGFVLAPMINAQGRLDNNQVSFELLITEDPQKSSEIAKQLYKMNEKRKKLTEEYLKIAEKQVEEDKNIIIIQGNFEKGVVGLIAGDIKEKVKKPVIAFGKEDGKGICKGSCRSVKPLHIKESLDEVEGLLENYGGHKYAAGLSIKKGNLSIFKDKLYKMTDGMEYKVTKYDLELDTSEISYNLVEDLKAFNPTGRSNPSPKFLIKDNVDNIKVLKGKHLKFKIGGVEAIAFEKVDEIGKLKNNEKIIGSLDINKFNNQENLQIKVKEIL